VDVRTCRLGIRNTWGTGVRTAAWQLAEAMKKIISKNKMATLLKTSRRQVDRLLSAKDDITLSSLQRAAAMVGRRVTIELV
jgi:antitoxin HicB